MIRVLKYVKLTQRGEWKVFTENDIVIVCFQV